MDAIWNFFGEFFSAVNLPYSIMLLAVLGYWLMIILGALDLDTLDLDLDLDTDVDVDMDVDMDADIDVDAGDIAASGAAGGGVLMSVLAFFNIGTVPLMIILSVYILVVWTIGMVAHSILGIEENQWLMLAVFVPNIIGSLFITKIIFMPLVPFFKKLKVEEGIAHEKLTGKTAKVISAQVTERSGQVQIKTDGAPIILNAMSKDSEEIKRDDEVVLLKREDNGVYLVKKFDVGI